MAALREMINSKSSLYTIHVPIVYKNVSFQYLKPKSVHKIAVLRKWLLEKSSLHVTYTCALCKITVFKEIIDGNGVLKCDLKVSSFKEKSSLPDILVYKNGSFKGNDKRKSRLYTLSTVYKITVLMKL